MLESCQIIYPQNGTLGNTEFFIDGRYRARYVGPNQKDKLLKDMVQDYDLGTELFVMINLVETLRTNLQNIPEQEAEKKFTKLNETRDALERAQSEGLILSSNNIYEYINIRHFLRHNLDTYDETARNNYISHYLKFYDKSLIGRMKSYIDVLHQMQHIVNRINPNRIIRYNDESNTKFKERARAAYEQNPNVMVEINHPFTSDKYKKLHRDLHKLIPNIKIVDEWTDDAARKEQLDDYTFRSYFLQTFQATESMVNRYCKMRGQIGMVGYDAWKYLKDINVLSSSEFAVWHGYRNLRKLLCHNHFDARLRKYLFDKEYSYINDLAGLIHRLDMIDPNVRKLSEHIREYTHPDGLVIKMDIRHNIVLNDKTFANAYTARPTQNNTGNISQSIPVDSKQAIYQNGIKINMANRKIADIQLPNGININYNTRSIKIDDKTQWYMNGDQRFVLQTPTSKLLISRTLQLMEYMIKDKHMQFFRAEQWRLDGCHDILLDMDRKIQSIKFNNILRTEFMHTEQGYNALIFGDGTIVLFANGKIYVRHRGQMLTYSNRYAFAATYDAVLQKSGINQNVR